MNHTPLPYADVAAAANRIIAHTHEEGGGTFDFKGNLQSIPFFVVGGAGESTIIAADDPDANLKLALFMQRQPRLGNQPDKGLLGTWVHEGNIHVDRVTVHQTYIDAVTQGFHRNQLAIWDGENNKEVILVQEQD